jgi:hypothetical protein
MGDKRAWFSGGSALTIFIAISSASARRCFWGIMLPCGVYRAFMVKAAFAGEGGIFRSGGKVRNDSFSLKFRVDRFGH